MPFDGSGNFVVYTPGNPRVAGTTISVGPINSTNTDFATGLTNAVTRDGQGKMGADFTPATDATYNLGSPTRRWHRAYVYNNVTFQGASFFTTLGSNPTANRALYLPDADGFLAPQTATLINPISANTGTTTVPLIASGLASVSYSEIIIHFNGVSLNGTADILLQIQNTAGAITSGYVSRCMTINNATMSSASFTTGFGFSMGNATGVLRGSIILSRQRSAVIPGGDTWAITGSLVNGIGTNGQLVVAGDGNLGSTTPVYTLDGLRLISSNGSDTFDAGTVAVFGRW